MLKFSNIKKRGTLIANTVQLNSLAQKTGISGLSMKSINKNTELVNEVEDFLHTIIHKATVFAGYARRKTVSGNDVHDALQVTGTHIVNLNYAKSTKKKKRVEKGIESKTARKKKTNNIAFSKSKLTFILGLPTFYNRTSTTRPAPAPPQDDRPTVIPPTSTTRPAPAPPQDDPSTVILPTSTARPTPSPELRLSDDLTTPSKFETVELDVSTQTTPTTPVSDTGGVNLESLDSVPVPTFSAPADNPFSLPVVDGVIPVDDVTSTALEPDTASNAFFTSEFDPTSTAPEPDTASNEFFTSEFDPTSTAPEPDTARPARTAPDTPPASTKSNTMRFSQKAVEMLHLIAEEHLISIMIGSAKIAKHNRRTVPDAEDVNVWLELRNPC